MKDGTFRNLVLMFFVPKTSTDERFHSEILFCMPRLRGKFVLQISNTEIQPFFCSIQKLLSCITQCSPNPNPLPDQSPDVMLQSITRVPKDKLSEGEPWRAKFILRNQIRLIQNASFSDNIQEQPMHPLTEMREVKMILVIKFLNFFLHLCKLLEANAYIPVSNFLYQYNATPTFP